MSPLFLEMSAFKFYIVADRKSLFSDDAKRCIASILIKNVNQGVCGQAQLAGT